MKRLIEIFGNGCAVVLLMGGTTAMIILIAVIGLFRSCMGIGEIDLDSSYMVQRYQFTRNYITDSTNNGFELLYYTTNHVTELRNNEIRSRQRIWDSYKRLESEAANYFNHDLINVDIYDFVEWAKGYDIDPDVRLTNIWVYGSQYDKLYHSSHPDYPDGWRQYDDSEFGILYLTEYDIYPYRFDIPRKYRYWNCEATSLTDERHTHIKSSDRKK